MDAFDADVLIYAAQGDPRGRIVAEAISSAAGPQVGIGSVLLLGELLIHPVRNGLADERTALETLVSRLVLVPVDDDLAMAAVSLGARYGLRTVDAIHLATAIVAGAERFITNNRRDFTSAITEIEIRYPP